MMRLARGPSWFHSIRITEELTVIAEPIVHPLL